MLKKFQVLKTPIPEMKVLFIGTYLPQQCGIATFTYDLCQAVGSEIGEDSTGIIAMTNLPEGYDYPEEVVFEIYRDRVQDYWRAAEYINYCDIDLVCLQHEFGIFGGPAGSHILNLLADLKKPVVTTFHTVLRDPEPHYRKVLLEIARRPWPPRRRSYRSSTATCWWQSPRRNNRRNNMEGDALRIGMLGPISWRTPPQHYGPWERVVHLLTEGLVARGVEVTLFATGDSWTRGRLVAVCPRPYSEDLELDAKVWEGLHIAAAFERAEQFDLIHNHFDFLPLTYSGLVKTPVLILSCSSCLNLGG